MFHRLGKKITITLVISISLFIILTSAVLYTAINKNIYESYFKTSIQYVQQKNQNFRMYMNLTEEISKMITNNNQILSLMDEPQSSYSIETILDSVKSSDINFSIIGIYLYKPDGTGYSSSNIKSMPSLETIKESMELASFLASKENSVWLIRNKNIPEEISIKFNQTYSSEKGILSYVSKIFDKNNNYKGLLIVGIDIMKLYQSYQEVSQDGFFNQGQTYILKDRMVLSSSGSSLIDTDLKNTVINTRPGHAPIVYKNSIIIFNNLSDYDHTSIVSIIPLKKITKNFEALIILLISASTLFILLSVFLGIVLSKSITQPLNKLYNKMQDPLQ